uniref:Lipoprotein n=1 Tax=Setaria italica TaxID=4555 RepID=K3ZZ14_SETIT
MRGERRGGHRRALAQKRRRGPMIVLAAHVAIAACRAREAGGGRKGNRSSSR